MQESKQVVYFLDTETTGLANSDQVIQVAVVDYHGNCLYSSYVNHPKVPMHPVAQSIHKIPPKVLQSAPEWPAIREALYAVLAKADKIYAHNAQFDLKLLTQTAALYNEVFPKAIAAKFRCTTPFIDSAFNSKHTISLQKAVALTKIDASAFQAHDAVGDAQSLAAVCRYLAKKVS